MAFDRKEYHKDYYNKNKEKIRSRLTKWQKDNPEKYKLYHERTKKKNPSKYLWHRAKNRATNLGLPFDITPEDVTIPERCPYLGIPVTVEYGKGNLPTAASLDRVDPLLGYVKGNIQVISRKANAMKQNATKQELLVFARSILRVFA